MGDVQKELAEIWPLLKLLNSALGSVETAIINFSMEKARDAAWSFAEKLSPLPEEQRQQAIIDKDEMIALFSRVISHPGYYPSLIIGIIRLGERGTGNGVRHVSVLKFWNDGFVMLTKIRHVYP